MPYSKHYPLLSSVHSWSPLHRPCLFSYLPHDARQVTIRYRAAVSIARVDAVPRQLPFMVVRRLLRSAVHEVIGSERLSPAGASWYWPELSTSAAGRAAGWTYPPPAQSHSVRRAWDDSMIAGPVLLDLFRDISHARPSRSCKICSTDA